MRTGNMATSVMHGAHVRLCCTVVSTTAMMPTAVMSAATVMSASAMATAMPTLGRCQLRQAEHA